MFSYSCPKFKCLFTFSRIVNFFQCKLSSVWSYVFLLNGPDKKPKQNSSKTKQHRQHQEAKSVNLQTNSCQQFFGALLQGLRADWLVCIGYIVFPSVFDWLRPPVLFFLKLHSLPLCKEKSYQVFWLGEGQK